MRPWKEDLNKQFEHYGKIGDIYIPRDVKNGGIRGFAFVRFYNEDDAREALKEDGKELLGCTMTVAMAEPRPPRREFVRGRRGYE